MLQREILIEIILTPDELAFEFTNMSDEYRAMFFNELASITQKWDRPFCFQLQNLINNKILTKEGLSIMEQIGEYGEPQ